MARPGVICGPKATLSSLQLTRVEKQREPTHLSGILSQSKASTSSSRSGYRREKLSPEFPLKWSQSMPLSEEGSTQLLWTEREMLLRGVSI